MEESLTVTQLNTRVQGLLRGSPLCRDVWVCGEISNLTKSSSGHYYFTLKDPGSEIRCALFAHSRQRMDFEPRENMKVRAFGAVDIYVQRGNYQFIVGTMRQSGVGELYLKFEELKRRLQAEGLFDESRKRPLPDYPRRIGVVTSETGAVIHDIITTSASRFPADILLAPSMVQGDGAARTIVSGIELLNRVGVDVIIVGRGGGSLEDLWPFNEEIVARAISSSRVPVVSAVGHETDFTIADFVADVRAPTPTGAAAIILRDRIEIRNQIDRIMNGANKALQTVVDRMRGRFDILDARLSPETAKKDLDLREMELDGLSGRMENALRGTVDRMARKLELVDLRLSPASASREIAIKSDGLENRFEMVGNLVRGKWNELDSSLSTESARLNSLNPTSVMERGYGIIVDQDGHAQTSVSGMLVGQRLDIRLRDGTARTIVREIKEGKQ